MSNIFSDLGARIFAGIVYFPAEQKYTILIFFLSVCSYFVFLYRRIRFPIRKAFYVWIALMFAWWVFRINLIYYPRMHWG